MIIKDYTLFHKTMPSQGKLLSIDVGTKRLGIAVCDELRFLTTPKKIINRQSNKKDFADIAQIFKEERAIAIVMGFPINMDGTFNEMSRFTQKFADELDKFLDEKVQIFFADERLTSFEAKEIALSISSRKKQKHFDDIAASVILRDFIAATKE
jgi:putative Holliday junction resolvase